MYILPLVDQGVKMSKNELDFIIFCIENVADFLGLKGSDVYELLAKKSRILDDYIIPCYDALHTQGKEYIVNDIVEYMNEMKLIK
jgi:hypothetical protein